LIHEEVLSAFWASGERHTPSYPSLRRKRTVNNFGRYVYESPELRLSSDGAAFGRVRRNTAALMRISAKADYAVRAMVELAAATDEKPVKAERIATAQGIPLNFLENILGELRHAGLVRSHRGAEGGFRLSRSADQISVADVIRAVEGPLASVRGAPPEESEYEGASEALLRVWIAVRANLRKVVEHVTVADVASGKLPRSVDKLADDPDGWVTR
jgi:Rrf2 family protein